MKSFYKIILLIYGCYFSLAASGQNLNLVSPITISIPNNPVANTDDWGKGTQPFIITAKKNTPNELQPWMLVTIKQGGSKICGSNTPQTATEVYFDIPLKTWTGTNASSLLGNPCTLKPGEYELCVQFYLKDRRTVIGENCKSFTIKETKPETYSPPQNILPAADKVFTKQEANGIVNFRWTPVLPKPKANVIYRLKVWQLMQGQNSTQAMKSNQPIVTKDVDNLTQASIAKLTGEPCMLPYFCSYVWKVEASKTSALGDIEMLGTSEATAFSVKANDADPVKYGSLVNQTPVDGKIFTKAETTRPIVFSWTPVLPKPKENVIYRLQVWLNKSGQSSADVIKNNKPIFVTETNLLIHSSASSACKDTLLEICLCYNFPCTYGAYVWNVEALVNGEIIAKSKISTYSASSAGCGTNNANVTLTCGKIINGKQTYNGVIQFSNIIPAGGGQQCTTVMNAITSATGIITGLATLPVTIPVGGNSSAVNFTYTPAFAGAATASFSYQGLWNDGSNNTSNFTTTNVPIPNCKKVSDCNCKSVQCTKKLWYKDVSTGIVKEFTCIKPTPIVLDCNKNYYFFADTKCSPNTNCKMIVKGEFRNAAGALVIQQTPFNSASSAFNIISGTPGNYTFTIKYYINDGINDIECGGNCTIPIVVSCNPSVDCCKNGNWYNKNWYSGKPLVFNGVGALPVPLPASGTNLGTWPCAVPSYAFHCSFACANNCSGQINYSIYNAATGILISTQTIPNATYTSLPAITTNGNYLLVIAAICGKDTCSNKLQYPFEIKCTPPVNCCQNATQKDPSVYDAAGANLATFSCTQPKAYYINAANKNCDKELIIKASANCGSAANCPSKITYTLLNTGTSSILTGTGVLTIPATLANGVYTLTVDYYCGNTICKSCKFEIKKDCPLVIDDCCKNSSWGEKIHYKSGGIKGGAVPAPLPASGSNLGVVACGSNKQFKICYNCAQGCGTAQIKYDVYLAYSLVLVSSTTVASCSVANITMPATAGNYQIRITAICNGKECNAMDYFINTECRPVDCCKGSYWTSKSLDWDIKIKLLQTDATTTDNQAAQKTNDPNKKEKKTPAGKIPPVGDIGVGQANLTNGSIKINNCGDTIKINEGGQYTFNAGYTCNTTLANCKGKVIAKVKDPNGITYGTWPLPHLFNFATAGKYTVTYYAYCGETVCDSCIFYVNAAKDCCKGSDWIKAEYQIVNKKSNGEYDHSDKTYYALPLKITNPIPVLKADGAIDLEKLEFSCAAGCTPGFILKRKNITTGVEETTEIITAGGTPSVYAKPYPQLITIVPTCGGISCGKPIVFRLECLQKDCSPCFCQPDTKFVGDPVISPTNSIGAVYYGACGSTIQGLKCNIDYYFAIAHHTGNVPQGCLVKDSVVIKNSSDAVLAITPELSPTTPSTYTFTTGGTYSVTFYLTTNGIICETCKLYFVISPCVPPVDCCTGGKWTGKSINWGSIKTIVAAGAVKPMAQAKMKTPKDISVEAGPYTTPPSGMNITKCDSVYHLGQNGTYTLDASYQCGNVNVPSCTKLIKVQIKGTGNSSLDGLYNAPVTKTFVAAGNYKITYYAYCGNKICDSCTYTLTIDKNCCLGSEWKKAEYQIVNKKPNGDWIFEQGFKPLPTVIGSSIPIYRADEAVNIEHLEYECQDDGDCMSGFIVRRKNLTTGALVQPDETLSPGQVSTSIYAKPFPQIIYITPSCGGKVCGNPIIFKLECLNKDCIRVCKAKDTLNYSTGIDENCNLLVQQNADPFWSNMERYIHHAFYYGVLVTASGQKGVIRPISYNGHNGLVTTKRCFYLCEDAKINLEGQFPKEVKINSFTLKNSIGAIIWNYSASSSANVYYNTYNLSLNLTKGEYCFEFIYNADAANNYGMFLLNGLLTTSKAVLANSENDCCAKTTNPTTSYGQAGNLYGLDLATEKFDTVKICEQTWMKKNLDVAIYRNGDPIPEVTDPVAWANLTTGAWCYYNNDPAMGAIYGKLYNWYAVDDPRGLAPLGWHVPSKVEWTTLINCLGDNGLLGGKMKETGTTTWAAPNSVATNSSGWSGLPGGYRKNTLFYHVRYFGLWWNSTVKNTSSAYGLNLAHGSGIVTRGFDPKQCGFSVRCLRD